jgi:hypothetical protein
VQAPLGRPTSQCVCRVLKGATRPSRGALRGGAGTRAKCGQRRVRAGARGRGAAQRGGQTRRGAAHLHETSPAPRCQSARETTSARRAWWIVGASMDQGRGSGSVIERCWFSLGSEFACAAAQRPRPCQVHVGGCTGVCVEGWVHVSPEARLNGQGGQRGPRGVDHKLDQGGRTRSPAAEAAAPRQV